MVVFFSSPFACPKEFPATEMLIVFIADISESEIWLLSFST